MLTLDCPFCERENPEDAKFCNACGSPLHLKPCKQCGAVDDARSQVCYKCGAPFPPRVPKLRPDLTPDQESGPTSGRLIELFHDSRDTTGDYTLRQAGPPLRAVTDAGRLAPVTRIASGRRLNEVMLTYTGAYGDEKVFRITHKAALRSLVVVAGLAAAVAFFLRDGIGPVERSAPQAAEGSAPVAAPQRPAVASVAASSPGTSPAAPAAVAPQTAALAASPPQTQPVAALEPSSRTATEDEKTPQPKANGSGAGTKDVPGPASETSKTADPPSEAANEARPASGTPGNATAREGSRRAAKGSRERRSYRKRNPSEAQSLAAVRAPADAPAPKAAASREPARPSYNCTAKVEALGLCSRNGK